MTGRASGNARVQRAALPHSKRSGVWIALVAAGVVACAGPAHTTTTTTERTEHTEGGVESHRETTETTETAEDGSSVTETDSSTETYTPPPS